MRTLLLFALLSCVVRGIYAVADKASTDNGHCDAKCVEEKERLKKGQQTPTIDSLSQQLSTQNDNFQAIRQQLAELNQMVKNLPTTFATVYSRTRCPKGFQYFPEAGSCFKVVVQSVNWQEARDICPLLDPKAHLAVIKSSCQNEAIVKYLKTLESYDMSECNSAYDSPGYFVSGRRLSLNDCSSQFMWMPDSTTWSSLTYTNWAAGEPNCENYGVQKESCMQLWKFRDYRWNDIDCSAAACALCQIDL
jgi:hypothetical protein